MRANVAASQKWGAFNALAENLAAPMRPGCSQPADRRRS